MNTTPKSLRLQLGVFGRTNVGKSSLLNLVAGQSVAITSPVPGTTTDVVEKSMELLPVGPVVFLDTAGLDDTSVLSSLRLEKTRAIFRRADIVILVIEPNRWGEYEEAVLSTAAERQSPVIIVVNKCDVATPAAEFLSQLNGKAAAVIAGSSLDTANRDRFVNALKRHLLALAPEDFLRAPALIGDLVPPGGTVIHIIPIDKEAPKGRIILPQVQAIRDCLDHGIASLVTRETEYRAALAKLDRSPDLVVCDSQVVERMVADTPADVKCTTYSILFARLKGDLVEMARGAAAIHALKPGDRVLIGEACSHHAIEDDIGRVKIPRWFRKYLGFDPVIETRAGRDFPTDLSPFRLVLLCGSCMITRKETLCRIEDARAQGVRVTNYGLAISLMQGVLARALSPFPAALAAYEEARP